MEYVFTNFNQCEDSRKGPCKTPLITLQLPPMHLHFFKFILQLIKKALAKPQPNCPTQSIQKSQPINPIWNLDCLIRELKIYNDGPH